MSDEYTKDPSRATIGPLADPDTQRLSSTENIPSGTLEDPDEDADDSTPQEEDDPMTKEGREMPGLHDPEADQTGRGTVPNMDGDDGQWEHPTDTNVHSADDVEALIETRVKKLQNETQKNESGGEVLKDQIEEQNAAHDEYRERPTNVEVDRDEEESEIRRLSGNPIDGANGIRSHSKMASDPIGLLEDREAHPIKLFLTLNNVWGEEWLGWEPETILEMADRKGVDIDQVNRDKLSALKVIHNVDDFWTDPRVFEKVVLAFNHRMVDWGHIQEPRLHEVVAAVELVEQFLKSRDFTEKIQAYIATVALRDGYVMLPPSLSFASFLFSEKILEKLGDEAMTRQERVRTLLDQPEVDEESVSEADAIQYRRILRCQHHAREMVNELKS